MFFSFTYNRSLRWIATPERFVTPRLSLAHIPYIKTFTAHPLGDEARSPRHRYSKCDKEYEIVEEENCEGLIHKNPKSEFKTANFFWMTPNRNIPSLIII